MLPSVLFSLQLIKFNQKCTHTSTKGTKGYSRHGAMMKMVILRTYKCNSLDCFDSRP